MPPPTVTTAPRLYAPRSNRRLCTLPPPELSSQLQYQDAPVYYPIAGPSYLSEQPPQSRYPYPQASRLPSRSNSTRSALYNQSQTNLSRPRTVPLDRTHAGPHNRPQMGPSRPNSFLLDRSQVRLARTTPGPSERAQARPYRTTPASFDRPQAGPSRPATGSFDRSLTRPFTSRPMQGPFHRPIAGPSRPVSTSRRTPPINASVPLENEEYYRRMNMARAVEYEQIHLTAQSRTEAVLFCPHCSGIPQEPVTGPCGHTRCRSCVAMHEKCVCGEEIAWTAINILVQRLTNSLTPKEKIYKWMITSCDEKKEQKALEKAVAASRQQNIAPNSLTAVQNDRVPGSCLKQYYHRKMCTADKCQLLPPSGPDHQDRFMFGRDLVAAGCEIQAVPHLAKAAAFGPPTLAKLSKDLLVQVLHQLYDDRQTLRITRPLHNNTLYRCSADWLTSGDLDCILCCQVYRNPVTTPCGHTYCRPCIERSMDHRQTCPLCSTSLEDFNVASTADTSFLVRAIEATGRSAAEAPEGPDWDNTLPIFVCTVAYPMVSCPLYVFEPRYRLMIRRCMRSRNRRFGMVNGDKDKGYADYGTVLEIRDCVLLADGRSILSTVGVCRFRVVDRDMCDGYNVARVEKIRDYRSLNPRVQEICKLYHQNESTWRKAEQWILSMDAGARAEIESSFGPLPPVDNNDYYDPDGPAWLWWVLAILPLRNEIKVMILSELNVSKRLFAIEHTLYVMDFRAETIPSAKAPILPAICVSQNWLQRAA